MFGLDASEVLRWSYYIMTTHQKKQQSLPSCQTTAYLLLTLEFLMLSLFYTINLPPPRFGPSHASGRPRCISDSVVLKIPPHQHDSLHSLTTSGRRYESTCHTPGEETQSVQPHLFTLTVDVYVVYMPPSVLLYMYLNFLIYCFISCVRTSSWSI